MRWVVRLVLLLLLALQPALAKPHTILAAVPISRMDLPWWRHRHEAKLEELHRTQPALILLGDSITQNWERHGPPDWADYAPVWQRFYGDRKAVNLGFIGDTTASLLWRIRNGEVSGIHPKVVIVLIGANNLGRLHWSASDTLAGIDAILQELHYRLPATKVLLIGILPSDRSAWTTETADAVNRALAARYPHGGAQNGAVTFIDVSHLFVRDGKLDRDLFYDPRLSPPEPPLHPTAQGMALIAKAIEPTLASLMGDHVHQ